MRRGAIHPRARHRDRLHERTARLRRRVPSTGTPSSRRTMAAPLDLTKAQVRGAYATIRTPSTLPFAQAPTVRRPGVQCVDSRSRSSQAAGAAPGATPRSGSAIKPIGSEPQGPEPARSARHRSARELEALGCRPSTSLPRAPPAALDAGLGQAPVQPWLTSIRRYQLDDRSPTSKRAQRLQSPPCTGHRPANSGWHGL